MKATAITTTTLTAMLTLVLVLIVGTSNAQVKLNNGRTSLDFCIAANTQISGNGHGVMSGVSVSAIVSRYETEVGILFSNTDKKVTGVSVSEKIFLLTDTRIKFFTQVTGSYNTGISLNTATTSAVLKSASMDQLNNTEIILGTFSTTEAYIGFGCKTILTRHLGLDTSFGVGAYTSNAQTEISYKTYKRFRPETSGSLVFKLGLQYRF